MKKKLLHVVKGRLMFFIIFNPGYIQNLPQSFFIQNFTFTRGSAYQLSNDKVHIHLKTNLSVVLVPVSPSDCKDSSSICIPSIWARILSICTVSSRA